MSMFRDAKHLLESKVPIYARNIIVAMLRAYGIREKSELFVNGGTQQTMGRVGGIQDRFRSMANYDGENEKRTTQSNYNTSTHTNTITNNHIPRNNDAGKNNKNNIIRDALMQFTDVIMKCIQQ